MGNGVVIDEKAQERIKNSKHKQKVLDYLNKYGIMNGTELQTWAKANVAQHFQSVTYTNFGDPTYRNNRQQLIETLEKAYDKDWRMYLLQFTDVVDVQKNEVVSSMVKWTGPKKDAYNEYYQIYHQYDAIFNKQTGKWLRSAYKQFVPDKKLFKQYPHFQTIGKTRPPMNRALSAKRTYTEPSSSGYGGSSSSNDNDKQREQQRKKQQEQYKKKEQRII